MLLFAHRWGIPLASWCKTVLELILSYLLEMLPAFIDIDIPSVTVGLWQDEGPETLRVSINMVWLSGKPKREKKSGVIAWTFEVWQALLAVTIWRLSWWNIIQKERKANGGMPADPHLPLDNKSCDGMEQYILQYCPPNLSLAGWMVCAVTLMLSCVVENSTPAVGFLTNCLVFINIFSLFHQKRYE